MIKRLFLVAVLGNHRGETLEALKEVIETVTREELLDYYRRTNNTGKNHKCLESDNKIIFFRIIYNTIFLIFFRIFVAV